MSKILAFGEILWDVIEGEAHLGGAPLNFSAHVNKCGLPSSIISCLGNDSWGDKAWEELQKLGVNTDLILRRNNKTGRVLVTLNNGQPDYEILRPVAYDYIDSGRLDHHLIEKYDVFYFGTLAQRAESSRSALYEVLTRHDFKHVFYDVNLRKDSFTAEVIQKSLQHATIFKINDEEVSTVSQFLWGHSLDFEEFCQKLVQKFNGIKVVIITAGGDGCYIYTHGQLEKIASDPVQVADTVGAGDSFSAAFMVSYLAIGDAVKSAKIANKVGGYVASQSGAIPDYSSEIMSLMKELKEQSAN